MKRLMSKRKKRKKLLRNIKDNVHAECSTVRKRRNQNHLNDVDADGSYLRFDLINTYWYRNYFQFPNVESIIFRNLLCRRFRLPHGSFLIIHKIINMSDYFVRWNKFTKIQKKLPKSPTSLFLLGSLEYLGRGWAFYDLEESTGISRDVHRSFFHKFVKFSKEILYPKFVKYPTCAAEVSQHSDEYDMAGMHGAVGSMDAFHVTIEKYSHILKKNHLGGNSKQAARSYNLTCNYRRQILHTTRGHYARWNDKTIVLYDNFSQYLKNGTIMQDNIFELYQKASDGSIIKVKYSGSWLLVNNGYLNWGITIPPMKKTLYVSVTRWSEWLESMRKDVEYNFEILKGRWRILKYGIFLYSVDIADDIWIACCALHNFLLEVDENNVSWDREEGLFYFDTNYDAIPFDLQRLSNTVEMRTYYSSSMGLRTATDEVDSDKDSDIIFPHIENTVIEKNNLNHVNDVRFLNADVFQKKLVEHFDFFLTIQNQMAKK